LEGSAAIDAAIWRAGLDWPRLVNELRSLVGSFQYNVALQRIWVEVLDAANRYIEQTQPFKLAKTDLEACKVVLVNLAEALRVAAILIKPFLPRTAETFYSAFNFANVEPWDAVAYDSVLTRPAGHDLTLTADLPGGKPTPLFPKVEVREISPA
jgi:methionyl-tRNA synthetase